MSSTYDGFPYKAMILEDNVKMKMIPKMKTTSKTEMNPKMMNTSKKKQPKSKNDLKIKDNLKNIGAQK